MFIILYVRDRRSLQIELLILLERPPTNLLQVTKSQLRWRGLVSLPERESPKLQLERQNEGYSALRTILSCF